MSDINVPNRTLYTADNLMVLRCMDGKSVDLIYLDPPFNTGRNFADPVQADISFEDTWRWSYEHQDLHWELHRFVPDLVALIDGLAKVNGDEWKAYLTYMAIRLKEMHRILKPTGSIYFHCDPTMSHGVKLVMDAIFGKNNFRNEIVWHYGKWSNAAQYYQRNHDIILFYSRDENYTFNPSCIPRQNEKPYGTNSTSTGRQLLIYDALATPKDIIQKYTKMGYKIVKVTKEGLMEHDTWSYLRDKKLNILNSQSKERTGYPTQKPMELLLRIIKASSNEGDVVLDPFCGCATACVAAEQLKRRWIGIDMGDKAVGLLLNRLEKMNQQSSGRSGTKDFSMFSVNWVYCKSSDRTLAKAVNESIDDWRQKSEQKHKTATEKKRQMLYKAIYSRVKDYADGKGVKRELPHRTDLPRLRDKQLIKEDKHAVNNERCIVCDKVKEIVDMQVDHIIPKVKGGQDEEKNLQLLCASCNRRKSGKTLAELVRTIFEERAAEGEAKKKKELDDRMKGKKS